MMRNHRLGGSSAEFENYYQQVSFRPRDLYRVYFSGCNLISEEGSEKAELEFPDGSKYKGPVIEEQELSLGGG